MEEELRSLLLDDLAVAAIVGTRVSWMERPQASALPALVLQVTGGGDTYGHGGRADLVLTRVQADCYGATYAAARTLARGVKSALSGYKGDGFGGIFFDSQRDIRDETMPERVYRVSQDYLVHHTES